MYIFVKFAFSVTRSDTQLLLIDLTVLGNENRIYTFVVQQGGALYFLEHVESDPSSWIYFFQHMLQPMWYYLGDGCVVTRATWRDLEAAGFSEIQLRHIEAPQVTFMIKPHILGYAIK